MVCVELGPGIRKDDGLGGPVEILQHQPGVLLAGLLRDLPLDSRHHRGHAHLLLAPLAQGGRGPGAEELDLLAVALQRVPGDEEAEHLLLLGQPLGLGPGGNVGKGERATEDGQIDVAGVPSSPSFPSFPPSPKSDPCPASRSCVEELGLGQRGLERLDQLLPVTAERVAGAGSDERLEHPLVAEPEVDPLHQLGQGARREPPAGRR